MLLTTGRGRQIWKRSAGAATTSFLDGGCALFWVIARRRLRIKDNDKRWMDALANNFDAKRDRAVSCAPPLLMQKWCCSFPRALTPALFRFLRSRWAGRKALAREQRKALGIENPVIFLETEASECLSPQAISPRSHVEMEEEVRCCAWNRCCVSL